MEKSILFLLSSMCTCEICFGLPSQHSKICERTSSACCGNNLQKRHFREFPCNARIITQRCYPAYLKQQQRDGEYNKLLKRNKRALKALVTGLNCLLVDTQVVNTEALLGKNSEKQIGLETATRLAEMASNGMKMCRILM